MRIIEIRRHSIRSKPGDHLSQEGVALARKIGETTGPFERVVTSTLPRAFETAIAMGFAVNEQVELLSGYNRYVENEVPWPQPFAVYAKAVRGDKSAAHYAQQLASFYARLAESLTEGQAALVINHGGVVELGVVASVPHMDYEAWGEAVDYCEGARLFWDAAKFVRAELLRVQR